MANRVRLSNFAYDCQTVNHNQNVPMAKWFFYQIKLFQSSVNAIDTPCRTTSFQLFTHWRSIVLHLPPLEIQFSLYLNYPILINQFCLTPIILSNFTTFSVSHCGVDVRQIQNTISNPKITLKSNNNLYVSTIIQLTLLRLDGIQRIRRSFTMEIKRLNAFDRLPLGWDNLWLIRNQFASISLHEIYK